jgi:hypothetical protein
MGGRGTQERRSAVRKIQRNEFGRCKRLESTLSPTSGKVTGRKDWIVVTGRGSYQCRRNPRIHRNLGDNAETHQDGQGNLLTDYQSAG